MEKRKRTEKKNQEKTIKKPRISPSSSVTDSKAYAKKPVASKFRTGILTRIVQHMEVRHLHGDQHPLALDEIINESNQLNIKPEVKKCIYFYFQQLVYLLVLAL